MCVLCLSCSGSVCQAYQEGFCALVTKMVVGVVEVCSRGHVTGISLEVSCRGLCLGLRHNAMREIR